MKYSVKKLFAAGLAGAALASGVSSCNNYLDIVPDDGVATIDMAFNMRSTAIKWLYSCYSYMTADGDLNSDPALLGGDELWTNAWESPSSYAWDPTMFYIALGRQNAVTPYSDDWNALYQGIRYCNTLIERVGQVPDIPRWEAEQWIAEAKSLKAYYHFCLIRKWGPIPIVKESLSVGAGVDEVRVWRDPIDDCFDYVLELLDEAIPYLSERPQSRDEWGRINKPIAAALKAKVAVTAASPLFNGNKDQQTLVDNRNTRLFPDKTPEQQMKRWTEAMNACKEAIDICHDASKGLYHYRGSLHVNDTLARELDLRETICDDWNDEQIWVNTQTYGANWIRQNYTCPNLSYDQFPEFVIRGSYINVPLKIADQFYTRNGLPAENDVSRSGVNPTDIREVGKKDRWYMREGYSTSEFNFDREPRFYAALGFDGSLWFGPNQNDISPSQLYWISRGRNLQGPTGYYCKKLVSHEMRVISASSYSTHNYQWAMLRLADLYLLYAEAINEAEGPDGPSSPDLYLYLDAVRARAGIPDVKTAWDEYSNAPGYYRTQTGMREIIHRERLIELAFEGHRFWDIRRWKTAPAEYDKGIYGWNVSKGNNKNSYYKITEVHKQPAFSLRDYFWPISNGNLDQNTNLVQNLGW